MSNESDASFVITKREGDGESIASTRKQMVDALRGIPAGKPVLGAIGRDLETPEVKSTTEELTPAEKEHKKKLIEFLFKYLDPPDMGQKFKPEQTRMVLKKKLEKQTLGELKRFWGKKTIPDELEIDDIEELRRKWKDISP